MNNHKHNHTDDNKPPMLSEIYSREEISEFVLDALLTTDTDSIYIKDPLGRLNMVNQHMINEMAKLGEHEIVGNTDKELFGTEFGRKTQEEEQHLYETGEEISSLEETREASPNNKFWHLTTKIPLKNSEGEIIGLIGYTKTINKLKTREINLRKLAMHDDLTNVFNRNGLFERMNKMKQQTGSKLAVLVIDIDNLKQINDHYFHKAGDEFLQWFAWILKSTTRGNDIVARIGGDEFVVILEEINRNADVESFCKNLYRNFNNSIDDRFKALGVGMSIGIARYPVDSRDSDQLIKMADEALYWSKNHNKGEVQFFNHISKKMSTFYTSIESAPDISADLP